MNQYILLLHSEPAWFQQRAAMSPQELQAIYETIMTKLPSYNGDQSWELPLAATYVVQKDGKISWARIDADWRCRPEPGELLQVLTPL